MADHLHTYIGHVQKEITILNDVSRRFSVQSLQNDPLAFRGAIYAIQTISEAVRHFPISVTELYPNIRWREIRAIGNFTRHEYAALQAAVIWEIIVFRVPELQEVILKIQADIVE